MRMKKGASFGNLRPQSNNSRCRKLLAESLPVFEGRKERLHHFGIDVVAVELVQLAKPEIVALVIQRRLRWIRRVPLQVSKVFHQHKRAIELLLDDHRILSDETQCV